MEMGFLIGLIVFIVAGFIGGAYPLPQKFIKHFAWENTWGTFWFFSFVVIPAALIPFCVKDIWAIWSEAGTWACTMTVVFGMLWGIGAVAFGAAVHMVGISLASSLMMGLVIVIGSLLPLFSMHTEKVATTGGFVILSGIAISIVGVALGGYAGFLKDRALKEKEQGKQTTAPQERKIILGLLIALLSGVTSSCLNLGYAFSGKINKSAIELGTPGWAAGLASWQLIFWGGLITSGIFAGTLMIKNGTWKKYAQLGVAHDSGLSLCMAILMIASILLYGLGAYFIGPLGTSVGYAAFVNIALIAANIVGFLTGEWKEVGTKPVKWIITAILVLVVGVCVLGFGNSLLY